MKSEHYKKVEEFMRLAKQDTPNEPVMPDEDTRELRARLILEEAIETINALGFDVVPQEGLYGDFRGFGLESSFEPDLVEIIDGCCDIKVVTTGTLVACGVPDKPFQEETDDNNLAKFGPGHSIREDGKLIKPPDHKPPRIKEVLDWVIRVIKRNLPKSAIDYTSRIARTGESEYACILRNRSGIDAGEIDMACRDCTHLSEYDQQGIVDCAYMMYENYCRQLNKKAKRDV